jgi:acetyl-CoA C-acetyltransferase
MTPVAIVGIGQIPVAEHWSSSLRMLAADAIENALMDAGLKQVDALYVGNAYGGSISNQTHLGALIADYAGLGGIESYSVEAADASGAAALRTAYLAVSSGEVQTALVVGVEKSTDMIAGARVLGRNVSLDADYEAAHGTTLTALAAMLMRRYMYEHQLDLSAFEGFTVNAHSNGARNSFAMYRNLIKPGRFASAPMVAEPVSLFDTAPDGDGAAAVILTSLERARDLVPHPIRITGSAVATDTLALADRTNMLHLRAVQQSTQKACLQANIEINDLGFFEAHDSFTIITTLSLEAAGFAQAGGGWKLAGDGGITPTGSIPISTFGGLKARGNPSGATGVYQAVEAVLQLRGQAGANQIANCKRGLIQNLGGIGSTAITHILES